MHKMELIPIIYHGKKYPFGIKSEIEEIAGHLDKETINPKNKYSLHTEYSHMKRKLNSEIIKKYPKLMESHKDHIPQLWKNEEWSKEFASFLIDIIGDNNDPEIIEIHPPFDDYCNNFDIFFKTYEPFEKIITNKFPNTKIFIENRCGTFYKKGNFLLSNAESILDFLDSLSKRDLKLTLVLDYPQVFSAEKIKLDNIKLDKIENFNKKIKQYINNIGGFHMWGKRKNESDTRWTPHTGDLNTFFSYNNDLKKQFLKSIIDTFSDDKKRYFVPEVNSGESDLQSIVANMIDNGFKFPKDNQYDEYNYKQIVSFEWKDNEPFINVYNSEPDITEQIKLMGIKNIEKGKMIRCTGYKDLQKREQVVCPNHNIVTEKNKQCAMCNSKDVFSYCVACRGIDCRNKSRIALEYCNKDHYVYLAYFPGNKIKVGTAFYERKATRLIEQGALMALYIAKTPSGKIAREIEREIVEMGYAEKVSNTYKANHLAVDKSKERVLNCLNSEFIRIKEQLSSKYRTYLLQDDIFDDYDKRKTLEKIFNMSVQTSLFDDDIIMNSISEENPFINNKEIVAVVGSLAITNDGNIKYFDIKKLLGWEITDIS